MIVLQGTATGKYHAAILSNREDWERRTVEAGLKSGDLAHAMPFSPELHFKEFSSSVADMKNSVAVSSLNFRNTVVSGARPDNLNFCPR